VKTAELSFTDGVLLKLYNPCLREAPPQTWEIVMDICRIGASFISWSRFSENLPNVFQIGKTRKFTMGPTRFLLWRSIFDFVSVCLSVCPQSVLWQNGWLDPSAVSGGEWGRSRDGCIRCRWWSSKVKGSFGVNLGRPIVTNGTFATRSSQIILKTCLLECNTARPGGYTLGNDYRKCRTNCRR